MDLLALEADIRSFALSMIRGTAARTSARDDEVSAGQLSTMSDNSEEIAQAGASDSAHLASFPHNLQDVRLPPRIVLKNKGSGCARQH